MPGYPDDSFVPDGTIPSITMFSATGGWMLAGLNVPTALVNAQHTPLSTAILRYTNGRWTEIERPVFEDRREVYVSGQNGIAFVSPTDFWIAGAATWWGSPPPTVTPMLAHYKDGVWDVYED